MLDSIVDHFNLTDENSYLQLLFLHFLSEFGHFKDRFVFFQLDLKLILVNSSLQLLLNLKGIKSLNFDKVLKFDRDLRQMLTHFERLDQLSLLFLVLDEVCEDKIGLTFEYG